MSYNIPGRALTLPSCHVTRHVTRGKKDKDRTYLENWRPISLTNVDAKIASKVIATRIIKVLPEIIHSNQTGYVSGRYIGEAGRSILDMMDYTKTSCLSFDYCFHARLLHNSITSMFHTSVGVCWSLLCYKMADA